MDYLQAVEYLLSKVRTSNATIALECAALIKRVVDSGGVIYVFGAGHSSLLAEEAFHRAGGLVPVYPILFDFLSPHLRPRISGKLERLEGVAQVLFDASGVSEKDAMWIVSNSGINAAAVEMAQCCRKNKVPTIALTSLEHSKSVKSRHSSGKRLFEFCDFVLDNRCPSGDALLSFDQTRAAAGSTVANASLYNWVLGLACKLWHGEGKTPPVYRSANLPGGDAHNEALEKNYRPRIPLL